MNLPDAWTIQPGYVLAELEKIRDYVADDIKTAAVAAIDRLMARVQESMTRAELLREIEERRKATSTMVYLEGGPDHGKIVDMPNGVSRFRCLETSETTSSGELGQLGAVTISADISGPIYCETFPRRMTTVGDPVPIWEWTDKIGPEVGPWVCVQRRDEQGDEHRAPKEATQ